MYILVSMANKQKMEVLEAHEYRLDMAGNKVRNKYPYKELPECWRNSGVIKQRPDTKWFEEYGSQRTFDNWIKEIHQAQPGNLLPLQWAADFVMVSRTAVLNKAKKGELFVFSYIFNKPVRSIIGSLKSRQTKGRYDYVLLSELLEWKDELLERYCKD